MPVNAYFKGHGDEVMGNMTKEYGDKKGKSVFYATANKKGLKPMFGGGVVEGDPGSLMPDNPLDIQEAIREGRWKVPTMPSSPDTALQPPQMPPDPQPMAMDQPSPVDAPSLPRSQAVMAAQAPPQMADVATKASAGPGPDSATAPPDMSSYDYGGETTTAGAPKRDLINKGSAQQEAIDYAKQILTDPKTGKMKQPSVLQNIAQAIAPRFDMHPNLTREYKNLAVLNSRAEEERKMQKAQADEAIKEDTLATNRDIRLTNAAARAGKPGMSQLLTEAANAKGRDGQPLFSDEELKYVAAGWKPPAEKADKFVAVAPGNPILNTGTGQLTPGMGEHKAAGGTGDFQGVFLPAYAKKIGKPVGDMSVEEIQAAQKAFGEGKETEGTQEMRAARLESMAAMNALHQLQISQQPTRDTAHDVASDIVSRRMAPDQLNMMAGSFGAAGAAFKRMVYEETKKIDPTYNFEEGSATYALTKSPGFQNTVRYMDSVRNSIPQLVQSAQALSNGKIKLVNNIVNAGRAQLNNINLGKFNTDRILVADEIGKILSGGGTGAVTSDAKLNQAMSIIKDSDDPALVAANMQEVNNLLGFRRGSLTKGTYFEKPEEQQHATPNPATPAPATGMIRVKRKDNQQTGMMPAANFDPAKYDKL